MPQMQTPKCANCRRGAEQSVTGVACRCAAKRKRAFPKHLAMTLKASGDWCPLHRFPGEEG